MDHEQEAANSSVPAPATGTPPVRTVTLHGNGVTLSGLLAEPAREPRALLVALHGGGMRAGYFDGRADPATSLLTLAASCGYTALAVDRPGYGRSAARLPGGAALSEQADTLRAALDDYRLRHPAGAGVLLVGHSLGGATALHTASRWTDKGLLGADVSGIGDRWAPAAKQLAARGGRLSHRMHWGPLALYPPGTFRSADTLITPVPEREAREILDWPQTYARLARHVRVPVRFTFAEHERWWRSDPETVRAMLGRLGSPLSRSERLPGAGHNISLGRTARAYHLRVLAFLEECLTLPEAAKNPPGPR
ncbi:alpha/beta fold hydrolase (plasmid) [Streptomyces castrisilvae]|uniref:Alpha/beta fold hydrolase n=1 Tax=Streptomyces castrisilvae TaxID=3033811 RepID=A0ABY9HW19_9ACTN|nr:alpha/beta fold hydrolase [Streptomyces sp. Mut1]WLQ38554.1 alpha/beta fold hydrolase [Streptomyces sp. Mut1]